MENNNLILFDINKFTNRDGIFTCTVFSNKIKSEEVFVHFQRDLEYLMREYKVYQVHASIFVDL